MVLVIHPPLLQRKSELSQCRSTRKSFNSRTGCSKRKRKPSLTKKCSRNLPGIISAWRIWRVSKPWPTSACQRNILAQWTVQAASLMKNYTQPCKLICETRIYQQSQIVKKRSAMNKINQVLWCSLGLSWCPLGSHHLLWITRIKVVKSIKFLLCQALWLEIMAKFEYKNEAIID